MKEKFMTIIENYTSNKEYLGDGYYRIRKKENEEYELAFLVPCTCGTTNVHPQITVELTEGNALPIKLFDMEVTPVKSVTRTEETAEFLDEEFKKLVDKFFQAKQLG